MVPFVVEAGEFGVLGADEVAAQFPFGQAIRPGRPGAVGAGAGLPDAGLQAGAGPVDHRVGGGVVAGEFVEPGQGRLGQAQPGHGFLVAGVGGAGDPGEPGQRFEGEPLDEERDHDDRGGEDQDEITLGPAAPRWRW